MNLSVPIRWKLRTLQLEILRLPANHPVKAIQCLRINFDVAKSNNLYVICCETSLVPIKVRRRKLPEQSKLSALRQWSRINFFFLFFFLVSSSSFSSSSYLLSRVSSATFCILRIWRWPISWHTFPRRAFVEFHRSEWSLASGSRASPIWSKVENRRCWRYSACRFSSSVPLRILALVRSPRRDVLRINKEKGLRGNFIEREKETGVNTKTDYEMSA